MSTPSTPTPSADPHPQIVDHPHARNRFAIVDLYGGFLKNEHGAVCSFRTREEAAQHLLVGTPTPSAKPRTRFHSQQADRPTLEEAQTFVEGYVESAPSNLGPNRNAYRRIQILCNEDGLSLGLPVNAHASAFAGYELRGNVIILVDDACWD